MATLNGLYMFVIDEQASYGVEVTEHPVETGVSLTDHVKRNGITLSIRGELVGINTTSTLTKFRTMHNSGTVCKYVGRLTLPNCLITDMSVTATHKVWGGYEISMTLKEIRTASTSYTKTTSGGRSAGTQQVTPKSGVEYVYHTVKKGDTVWALVASNKAPYKNLKRPNIKLKSYSACNWVMAKNPNAFSRSGDFGTLKIGYKLIVGQR